VLNDGDLSLLNQNSKSKFRQNCGCIYGLSCREKLKDERTGLTHDFTRKDGVAHSEIISNLDIEIDRSQLWNLAEKSENRKDARTAREWVIALPDELDADQRKDLAKAFATALVDRYGVIADLAIHEPSKGGNDKNHHAHIMLTTRKAELDPENNLTLTTKADIELSNAKRKASTWVQPKRTSNKFGQHGQTWRITPWNKQDNRKN
jgi:ATP-dependent exoDNAse (exonuclease V) alpha subunit